MAPVLVLAACGVLLGQPSAMPALIPQPVSVVAKAGHFDLSRSHAIDAPVAAQSVADVFAESTDFGKSKGGRVAIRLSLDPKQTTWGNEQYRLTVDGNGVQITARDRAGLSLGSQTLRQLVAGAPKAASGVRLPYVTIEDSPRFQWRGMHLDVSRHFFTVAEVKAYIDYLAQFKFNVFHWHLIDDGGWRIEIKRYPKLTEIGAWRRAIPRWNQRELEFPGRNSGVPTYGGFYTQAQIKEVVAYASKRNVMVVPEIELPGHTMPSLAAYPELTCANYDKQAFLTASNNAFPNVYCAGKEATFQFLQGVLEEVIELFPSKYLHIGGDEVNKSLWARCSDCRRRMTTEKLDSLEQLQSYFIRRMESFLTTRGKRLVGWDEILEGGLAPNAVVMSWRGVAGGIEAARSGHDVVMSPTDPCYFDYSYQDNSIARVYQFDPVPASLEPAAHRHILGGQGNVWTEWMQNFGRVQEMVFPRMMALAEALWSPKESRDWKSFQSRLGIVTGRLIDAGVSVTLPAAETDVTLIVGESRPVTFAPAPYSGLTLRTAVSPATLSGRSPAYRSSIQLSPGRSVSAAFFDKTGKRGPMTIVTAVAAPPNPGPLAPGIKMESFRGTWRRVPDFSKLPLERSRYVGSIQPHDYKGQDNYALRFSGYITVPQDGVYTFHLGSDDGSWATLAGAKLVDNDDLHAFVWATGRVYLKAGSYPVQVGFFEQGGADDLRLEVEGPGISRQAIPSEWLGYRP